MNTIEELLQIATIDLDVSETARKEFVSLECGNLETYDSIDSPFVDKFPELPRSESHRKLEPLAASFTTVADMPCCSRFSLSADKIRATPKSVYKERRAALVAMDRWSNI